MNITLLLSLSCSLSFLLPLYFFSHSPLEDSLPERVEAARARFSAYVVDGRDFRG